MSTDTYPWDPGQVERYRHALDTIWDELESTYYATVKRVGLQSMAAQHAANHMRRARLRRELVEGLLARDTRTAETPDSIRQAVADLHEMKRNLNEL
jgi:hypothetical protein